MLNEPPHAFMLPRDPNDEMDIDLAIASGALLVVSRDNDLLDLMHDDDPVGVELRRLHPTFRILTPPEFIELAKANA
jgi:predicted nucleic acid-binding protein